MVNSLLEEFQFFSRYPEKELVLTSFLFGALIQNAIVGGMALGNALRHVLDAVRSPAGTPLNSFGVQALRQFQPRLSEWFKLLSLSIHYPTLGRSTARSYSRSPISRPCVPRLPRA